MSTQLIVNQKVKLTKSTIDKVESPKSGQTFLRDSIINGFALRITAQSKAFVVEKRIDGKSKRITLGRYPEMTTEQARIEAQKFLGMIASGVDPVSEQQKQQLSGVTLAEAFEEFCEVRKKNVKPRTLYDYGRVVELAFPDWKNKPLKAITKDMVSRRHTHLGETRGHGYANLSLRFLRALFNFAIAQYELDNGEPLLRFNPVIRITQTRSWYRVTRRQTYIKPHQLAAWYQAVESMRSSGKNPEHSSMVADYFLFLLFTGMRRSEAANLKWSDVDLLNKSITVANTKNYQPLTLPISSFLETILLSRKARAVNAYVFPGSGKTGILIEPRVQVARVMVRSGVEFTLHDLRRTFITIADSLDISGYAVKRLVNHKISGDVTAGYIITDVERLRAPMQRITDYMLKSMKMMPSADVIELPLAQSK
jgi:integrase